LSSYRGLLSVRGKGGGRREAGGRREEEGGRSTFNDRDQAEIGHGVVGKAKFIYGFHPRNSFRDFLCAGFTPRKSKITENNIFTGARACGIKKNRYATKVPPEKD
jgi:hypothetical protein